MERLHKPLKISLLAGLGPWLLATSLQAGNHRWMGIKTPPSLVMDSLPRLSPIVKDTNWFQHLGDIHCWVCPENRSSLRFIDSLSGDTLEFQLSPAFCKTLREPLLNRTLYLLGCR